MKAILLSTLALISAITIASDRHIGDFPKIQFGNILVPVDQVCVDGSDVKTIYRISICTAWKKNGESVECTKQIKKILKTPIDQTKENLIGDKALETSMSIPLTYRIQYGYYARGAIIPVYTKKLTIYDCE